jgi:uncharacterized protein DUF6459
MPALPPDRPGALPPAPGERPAGGPGGTGPIDPGCPRPPAAPRRPGRPRLPAAPRRPARPRFPDGPRPLPDPAAVRLYLIPDSAPPYDGEVTAPGQNPADTVAVQDAAGAPVPPAAAGSPDIRRPYDPPRSRGLPGSPAPSRWPGQFAQVLAETLAGSRSARQLVPWTTERARDRIRRLGPQLSAGQQPRVRRVVTCHPTADAMEMTVVVGFGKRVHALAVRLERTDCGPAAAADGTARPAKWLCVAVEAA